MAINKIFNKRYIIGVDPGSGSSSPLGLCLYDSVKQEILMTESIWPINGKSPKAMGARERIFRITEKLKDYTDSILDTYGIDNVGLSIEAFLLKGKGGETLMRLKGAVLSKVPIELEVIEVQNTTVKKRSGGHGGAEKREIADHLLFLLPESNWEKIRTLVQRDRWDEIDAIGIAYSAVGASYEKN